VKNKKQMEELEIKLGEQSSGCDACIQYIKMMKSLEFSNEDHIKENEYLQVQIQEFKAYADLKVKQFQAFNYECR
jgi:hypothetical protein